MEDARLASSRLHADVERLHAQVGLSWPKEVKVLVQAGLRDGMSILEVGSGPGFITESLLTGLPHCTVTAVELDPRMCDVARAQLANQPPDRFEIVQASILMTDLPDDTFDFALARFVFQHLAAPDLALLEILRLLKPGGSLAIVDVDDGVGGMVVPRGSAFDAVGLKVRQVQAGQAGDREIGRKLWRLLAAAGFTDLGLEAVVFHSDELGLDPFLPQYAPERYRPFVGAGGLTPAEWEGYRTAYASFVDSPDAFILQLVLVASGRKPPDAKRGPSTPGNPLLKPGSQ
ncbi:MAG TPA: methyltransferase domain-containing protein [Chloroflexota bacterium]|nr:methyltransferase domain-containing protein [Chloroflexota bacterium]